MRANGENLSVSAEHRVLTLLLALLCFTLKQGLLHLGLQSPYAPKDNFKLLVLQPSPLSVGVQSRCM